MVANGARSDTGLSDEFDDPDMKAFVRAFERLLSEIKTGEHKAVLDVGLFLSKCLSMKKRSAADCRLLGQMADVLLLSAGSTGEERLMRAKLLVETFAPRLQNGEKQGRVLFFFARRVALETAESKLFAALKVEADQKFIADSLQQWVPGKPRNGEKSSAGVLGALAYRFKLWGIAAQDEDNARRSIQRRIEASTAKAAASPSRPTRAKAGMSAAKKSGTKTP